MTNETDGSRADEQAAQHPGLYDLDGAVQAPIGRTALSHLHLDVLAQTAMARVEHCTDFLASMISLAMNCCDVLRMLMTSAVDPPRSLVAECLGHPSRPVASQ